MFTRDATTPPEKLIQDGKPQFGTYQEPPLFFDIQDVWQPFSAFPPVPFLTNLRIRGNLSFCFSTPTHIGRIDLLDVKFFCFSEFVLWEKSTGKKTAYRNIFGGRRLLPKNTRKAVCSTYKKRRYYRIGWNYDRNRISVHLNVKGDSVRPDLTGTFIMNTLPEGVSQKPQLFTLSPFPTQRRCSAAFVCGAPLTGDLQAPAATDTAANQGNIFDTKGLGVLTMRRAYYNLRSKATFLTGLDTNGGRQIMFHLAQTNTDAVDANTYNENVLFADNTVTPLPSVTVTRPYGINGKWIIQDTENMVDLFFTPISDNHRIDSLFILTTDYHTMYGTFEGDLKTADGEILHLKSFAGIAQYQYLRM